MTRKLSSKAKKKHDFIVTLTTTSAVSPKEAKAILERTLDDGYNMATGKLTVRHARAYISGKTSAVLRRLHLIRARAEHASEILFHGLKDSNPNEDT